MRLYQPFNDYWIAIGEDALQTWAEAVECRFIEHVSFTLPRAIPVTRVGLFEMRRSPEASHLAGSFPKKPTCVSATPPLLQIHLILQQRIVQHLVAGANSLTIGTQGLP